MYLYIYISITIYISISVYLSIYLYKYIFNPPSHVPNPGGRCAYDRGLRRALYIHISSYIFVYIYTYIYILIYIIYIIYIHVYICRDHQVDRKLPSHDPYSDGRCANDRGLRRPRAQRWTATGRPVLLPRWYCLRFGGNAVCGRPSKPSRKEGMRTYLAKGHYKTNITSTYTNTY